MRLSILIMGVVLATLAEAEQVEIWHASGETLSLFAVNPNTGDLVRVVGETTPGDFVRRNADGTYFASFRIKGDATFDVAAIPGGPEFVGEGTYTFDGSVRVTDPDDPVGTARITPDRFVLRVDATLADAGGGLWRLKAKVQARDGDFTQFDVDFDPLP